MCGVPGCRPSRVRPTTQQWTSVDLSRHDDTGALTIDLSGDRERRVESWGVRLRRAEPGRMDSLGSALLVPFGRRLGHRRTFAGLQEGRYTVEFLPDAGLRKADFLSFHCPAVFALDIKPGGMTRHPVDLQAGGYAQIDAPAELARKAGVTGTSVHYQIRDDRGKGLATRVVSVAPDATAGVLPTESTTRLPKGSCRFHPVLPVGSYTLELWGLAKPRRVRVPFVIKAFEVTTIAGE